MNESNEYMTARAMQELIKAGDIQNVFKAFDELYSIISTNDLMGIDIYLCLEELLCSKSYYGSEIMNILDKLFLQYSFYEVDKHCKKMNISRYDCWSRYARVVNCVQPVFFHYVNEKEFIGRWDSSKREWIK